jgi:hypothetical protein
VDRYRRKFAECSFAGQNENGSGLAKGKQQFLRSPAVEHKPVNAPEAQRFGEAVMRNVLKQNSRRSAKAQSGRVL